MMIKNPYMKRKRELIFAFDSLNTQISGCSNRTEKQKLKEKLEKLQKEFDTLEQNNRKFTQQMIEKASEEMRKNESKAEEVKKDTIKYPSLNKQLKEILELHRESKRLEELIKKYKYELYEEQKINRLKNKIETNTEVKLQ